MGIEKSSNSMFSNQDKHRYEWCHSSDIYQAYHDLEWGVPLLKDRKLSEFLILKGVQAGLS